MTVGDKVVFVNDPLAKERTLKYSDILKLGKTYTITEIMPQKWEGIFFVLDNDNKWIFDSIAFVSLKELRKQKLLKLKT